METNYTHQSTHRRYRCQCGRPVFFANTKCLACGTPLGYIVDNGEIAPLAPGKSPGSWQKFGNDPDDNGVLYRCANFDTGAGCNWMVTAEDHDAGREFCTACRLNRTIPDLSLAENAKLWQRVEAAKRRLVSSLLALGLPVQARTGDNPEQALMFDFLRAPPGAKAVTTGHLNGLITLNIEEADDAKRERARVAMHEPYRTLLGHLRHEIGHYYWQRLVAGTFWLGACRSQFGDERLDYAAALERHYRQGPPNDWQQHYVSAYAASHPSEDWAETWAHYLHMVDALDTAASFGLVAANVELEMEPFGPEALFEAGATDGDEFLALVNDATKLTGVLNELSRSMGERDFYPFVLSINAVRKLHVIHRVIRRSSQSAKVAVASDADNAMPAFAA